jgi:type I restriction-modification system DNA methylase subunit
LALFDEESRYRLNAFDWRAEFPGVFEQGGFDAVIGNPPYVRVHRMQAPDKAYFWKKYGTFIGKSDLYTCFMEKGLSLLRLGGFMGLITPHTWTSLESHRNIRRLLYENAHIRVLCQLPSKAFRQASVETCAFCVRKRAPGPPRRADKVQVERLDALSRLRVRAFPQREIGKYHEYNFLLYTDDQARKLMSRLAPVCQPLGEFVEFRYGLKTGDDERFLANKRASDAYKKLLRSGDIFRYGSAYRGEYVRYAPREMVRHRRTARPGESRRFESDKIIVARMGKALVATLDKEKYYVKDGMLLLARQPYDLGYLLGLLNSALLTFLYRQFFVTVDVLKNALLSMPIRRIDFANPAEKRSHDTIASLAAEMLELNRKRAKARSEHDQTVHSRQIQAKDKEIDRRVCELYGLTGPEIEMVEGG